jgi:PAS domain S-box-containing protein
VARVLLVDVDAALSSRLRDRCPELAFDDAGDGPELLERLHGPDAAGLDALVVGAAVSEPVRMAQRAQAVDRDLAVVILGDADHHARMAAAVRCAPFLTSAVSCASTGDLGALSAAIADVAGETRRRRAHRAVEARSGARLASLSPAVTAPVPDFAIYLEQLLDCAPIGVLAVDPAGDILACNRFAATVLRRSERELVGDSLAGFFSPADGRRVEALIARSADGANEGSQAEIVALAGDGETMLEIVATWISERLGRPGIMIVMQDVTDRESARTIRQLNVELERRVAELDAANRELDAFAYSVSHDLRAPLRAIDGFSNAVLCDHADALDDDARRSLQRVRAGAQRMSALIDDLLDLSRISRAPMRKERIDLGELARPLLAQLAARAPERTVEVDIAGPLTAMGDGRLITVVLENLIDNAWKFTSRRSDARIALGREERGEQMAFFVRDNGAGFDMKYAHRLFTPFQRLHDAAEFEGTGVGLATASRIVARHGGRIWADAAPDQGATFYFTLGGGR